MDSYANLAADLHTHLCRDPNRRVVLGLDRDLGRLPDPSAKALAEQLAEAEGLLKRARALLSGATDPDERVDLEVAAQMLGYEIHRETLRFNGLTRAEQCPSAGSEIGDGIFYLFVNDPRPPSERMDDILARLEEVPEYLHKMLTRLVRPVSRWVEMELDQIAGLPELLRNVLAWSETLGRDDWDRRAKAHRQAEAALTDYAAALCQLPRSESLALTEADARELVRLRGVELSFEELHALAREFLARTNADIETLREKLVARYGLPADTSASDLHAYFVQNFAVQLPHNRLSDVLDRYREEARRLDHFLAEHPHFPIPDDQRILILETPDFLVPQIPAGAMAAPPPFREGTRQSIMYLTLTDELLDEHNELEIPGMMLHEGIPGHHLQLTWASMHPSIIRRHVDANDLAEGWTTMLEDFMLDIGYCGALTDEARFAGRRGLARLAARVSIDLFFMTGQDHWLELGVPFDRSGDAFAKAGSLLASVTGFSPARVHAELNWNCLERGYPLSYLAGNALMWGLRRDFDAANPGGGPRAFHEAVLRTGNLPLAMMRRLFAAKGLIASA